MSRKKIVVYYDDGCTFCSYWKERLDKWDSKNVFRFYSVYQKGTRTHRFKEFSHIDSILVTHDSKILLKSDAILFCVRQLGGLFWLSAICYIIPRILRDWIYDIIAKNRQKICVRKT